MKIVIEVKGGCVSKVTADHEAESLEVLLIDYDDIAEGGPSAAEHEFIDGETAADLLKSGIGVW